MTACRYHEPKKKKNENEKKKKKGSKGQDN